MITLLTSGCLTSYPQNTEKFPNGTLTGGLWVHPPIHWLISIVTVDKHYRIRHTRSCIHYAPSFRSQHFSATGGWPTSRPNAFHWAPDIPMECALSWCIWLHTQNALTVTGASHVWNQLPLNMWPHHCVYQQFLQKLKTPIFLTTLCDYLINSTIDELLLTYTMYQFSHALSAALLASYWIQDQL